jgi:hypothetical protein
MKKKAEHLNGHDAGRDDPYSAHYIEKCRHCDFHADANPEDPYFAQCQLCDRFFNQKRLFLNNVG